MKLKYITLFCFISAFVLSCGGGDSGGGSTPPTPPPPPPVAAPSAATLIFPEDNTECNISDVLSDTQSTVTFQWNASENTDTYEVQVRNLNSNNTLTAFSNTTEVPITIERGTPYEWSVISSANGTNETATSAAFRFFNEGPGIENYAPFPADVIAPARGSTVPVSTVSLQWLGGDIDDDITGFEILFGTDSDPTNSIGSTTDETIDVDVMANTVYFWRVISTDGANNASTSEIFEFRTE